MKQLGLLVPGILMALLFARSPRSLAEEVTVEGLLKTLPVLSPENKDLTSFQCIVTLPAVNKSEPSYLKTHLAWSAPDTLGCLMVDESDNIPFAFWAQKKAMLYDATSASLTLVKDELPAFELRATDEKMHFGYGFTTKANSRFVVDLPSIVLKTKNDYVLKQIDDNQWEVTSTSKSGFSRVIATFDVTQACPVQSVEVRITDIDRLYFSVTDIEVNASLDARLREFPSAEHFPPDLTVKEYTAEENKGFVNGLQISKKFFTILYGRNGLADESVRNNPLLKNIDWDAALRTDEIVGPSMRALFNIPDK